MVISSSSWRYWLAGLALLLALAVGLGYLMRPRALPIEAGVKLIPASFGELAGWRDDDQAEALAAFLRSCERLTKQPKQKALGPEPWAGRAGDWAAVCEEAGRTAATTDAARAFFEQEFYPYRVADTRGGDSEGLFTGYYEPLLEGAAAPDKRFKVPLYSRPPDLVDADLGRFDPDLKGKKAAGRVVVEGTGPPQLVPYHARADIARGAIAGRGLELVWVDDPLAAFFLEIQGSGRVRLRDGSLLRVGYSAWNGQPYRSLGKEMAEMGLLDRKAISMQSIRDWLVAHPERVPEILARNPSYIFFRSLPPAADDEGPPGALEAPLTAGRSIAVDRHFLPLGPPFWLEASPPTVGAGPPAAQRPIRRLVVAQDTGGAIKGPVRGDLFWGAGAEAEFAAGHMQSRGRYYILLPRSLAPTS